MSDAWTTYLLTLGFAAFVAVAATIRVRTYLNFGLVFTCWFALYSFVGPLPFLMGVDVDNFSRSYLVWERFYPLTDGPAIYEAHILYTAFLAAWAYGYFVARGRAIAAHADPGRHAAPPLRSLPIRSIAVMLAVGLGVLLVGSLFQRFGSTILSGGTLYAGAAGENIGKGNKAMFSLWGASLVTTLLVPTPAGTARRWTGLIAATWVAFFAAGLVMGDRSQLFTFLIAGFVARFWNRGVVGATVPAALFLGVMLAANVAIRQYRGYAPTPEELPAVVERATDATYSILGALGSAESFAPYASLPIMVQERIEPTRGTSVNALVEALVPRVLAPSRSAVSDAYSRYKRLFKVETPGQGFTMHLVSDFYLNFGRFGVVVGGLIIGLLMGGLERRAIVVGSPLAVAMFALLMGAIPAHLRGGIEGIRAVLYEYWLVPAVVLAGLPMVVAIAQRWHRSRKALLSQTVSEPGLERAL